MKSLLKELIRYIKYDYLSWRLYKAHKKWLKLQRKYKWYDLKRGTARLYRQIIELERKRKQTL